MPTIATISDKSRISESVKGEEFFEVPEAQKQTFVRPPISPFRY
jgi:hypothetical protein